MSEGDLDPLFDGSALSVTVLEVSNGSMINFNYLVADSATAQSVIVDPAWQVDKINKAISDSGTTLKGILVTHSHFDHINLAAHLSEEYDCPIWMSSREIADSGFRASRLVAIGCEPWSVGSVKIEPILTPGHTQGCVCYRIGENVFTGDVLFAEGCGICRDVPAAYAMYESLEYLKAVILPGTRVFPGHSFGRPVGQLFSQLLRDNIYLQFSNRESFAKFRLRKGQVRARMFGSAGM